LEENIYNRRFIPDGVIAIKSWMNGESFGEICKMTKLEEGKIYNLISRIYLFFEEIVNFYTSLGIVREGKRIENIKNSILRGIMGVQSLYLQDNINFDINKSK
jgi:superfamily II RNA helicase